MKWFVPKVAKQEYTDDMMPHSRKEVFRDVCKLHLRTLLLCGLILFVFLLPLHITALCEAMYKASVAVPQGASDETVMNAILSIISFSNTRGVIDIACWLIFSIGLSGVARVVRQYAWEENVYFRYEFALGVKQNFKQFAMLGVLVGLLSFIANYISNLATLAAVTGQGEVYAYLGILPTVIFSIFLIPPALYAVVNVTVYNNSFRQNIKVGFVLYAKHVWKSLLAVLCCAVVFVPVLIPNIICIIIGRILSSLILPFIMLGWWLFAYNRQDEQINPKFAPELIGRGVTPMTDKGLGVGTYYARPERVKKRKGRKQ